MRIQNTNKDRDKEYIEYLKKSLWVVFVFINSSSCFLCYNINRHRMAGPIRYRCCDIATVSSTLFSFFVLRMLRFGREIKKVLALYCCCDLKRLQGVCKGQAREGCRSIRVCCIQPDCFIHCFNGAGKSCSFRKFSKNL